MNFRYKTEKGAQFITIFPACQFVISPIRFSQKKQIVTFKFRGIPPLLPIYILYQARGGRKENNGLPCRIKIREK